MRGALPWGVLAERLPFWPVFLVALVGNLVPAILILLYLKPFLRLVRRFSHLGWLDEFITVVLKLSHRRHSRHFERWGNLALFLFVAIPLPGTGAWTGALLAFLFNLRFSLALLSIAAGVLVAGFLVTVLTLGGINLWNFLG